MHPLQELELFYLDIRRQVEANQLQPDTGMNMVTERRVVDAAGVMWGVNVQQSSATRAAFLCAYPGQPPQVGDPSRFALAQQPAPPQGFTPQPVAQPPVAQQPFAASTYQNPSVPSYQAQPQQSFPHQQGFGNQQSFPNQQAPVFQPMQGNPQFAPQEPAMPSSQKRSRKTVAATAGAPKNESVISKAAAAATNFQLTPRVVTGLVVAFVCLSAIFMFFRLNDPATPKDLTPGPPTTITQTPVTDPLPGDPATTVVIKRRLPGPIVVDTTVPPATG